MALSFDGNSTRVVYDNIGNLNSGAKSILLDFFLPNSASQINNDFFSATRNSGPDTFQNFLLQLSDEGGTINSVRAAHFGTDTGQVYTTSDVLAVGQWNRIVWTCSNCAQPSILNTKIYVNAVSQAIQGGSTGSALGATNGDVCIGNRAHLDRGINGQIARFVIIDRVADEAEIDKFELGFQPDEIFSTGDFLLKPNTAYLSNWDSVVDGTLNPAVISNASQIQDPSYGLASVSTVMGFVAQKALSSKSVSSNENAIVGVAGMGFPSQNSAVITEPVTISTEIRGSFDGGTIDEMASSVDLSSFDVKVTLKPRKFPYRASGVNWLTVQGRINNVDDANSLKVLLSETDFDLGQSFTTETKLWWRSVTGTKEDWSLFDNNVITAGNLVASNNSVFSVKDIYIGDQPGYYYTDLVNDVQEWLDSPYVLAPEGASIDASISTLTSVADENGRLSGPLKQYALRISDNTSTSTSTKLRILVFANIHPGEMVAKWAVKGFVEWLIGGSAKANLTRQNFEVFVVWVNSTGLFLGHPVGSELTGAFADKNLNRDWGDFDLEATRKARDWILAHLGSDISYVIDFHNLTWNSEDRIFRDPTAISIAFCDAVDANYSGNIVQQGNTAPGGFTTHYFKENFGVEGATLEPRRGTNSLHVYQQFGAAAAEALRDMFVNGDFGRFASAKTQNSVLRAKGSATNSTVEKSAHAACVLW